MAKHVIDFVSHHRKSGEKADWMMDSLESSQDNLTVQIVLDRPSHYHLFFEQGERWAESTSIERLANLSIPNTLLVYTRSGAVYYITLLDGEGEDLREELQSILTD